MKKKVFRAILMLFFAVVFTSCSSNTNSSDATNSQTPAVSIENSSFNPSNLTVQKGAKVEWTNNDTTAHNIKVPSFISPEKEKGETFEAVRLILKTKGIGSAYKTLLNKNISISASEELRIAYVGMTRPSKILVIAVPNDDNKNAWENKLVRN